MVYGVNAVLIGSNVNYTSASVQTTGHSNIGIKMFFVLLCFHALTVSRSTGVLASKICVEVLRPSQPNRVMSSTVS